MLLGLWLVPLELGSESAGKMAVAVGSHRLAVDWIRFKVTRSSRGYVTGRHGEKAEACEDGSLDADRDPQQILDAGSTGHLEDRKEVVAQK